MVSGCRLKPSNSEPTSHGRVPDSRTGGISRAMSAQIAVLLILVACLRFIARF
jgi:hypothetical protein